jgi:MFS transporter, DHA1 family, inner membrane transport protein
MDSRLLVLALGAFAIGTDSFVMAGILTDVARSLDVSIGAAGQLITVYALAYGLMTSLMAALTVNWPRKRVLLAGLGIFAIGNILTAIPSSLAMVLAGRAIAGLGGAIFTPTASATAATFVPPEQRGRALAVVLAGLSGATALGAPIGTYLGAVGDWRITMIFVTALGILAALGVVGGLPQVPPPPPLSLSARLAPLGDRAVAATLLTTFLVLSGLYLVYNYISSIFDRATGGEATVLAGLLSVWGVAATIGNLGAGWLTDRLGSRVIINGTILILSVDFAVMPWSAATLPGTLVALVVWGLCGWGFLVPQQHRLIGIAPQLAPILLSLNGAAIYVAVSASGVLGALALGLFERHDLPLLGTAFILTGLLAAEGADRLGRHGSAAADMPDG